MGCRACRVKGFAEQPRGFACCQLALAWLATAAPLVPRLPVLDVAVIAALNAAYWLPIRGESPGPPNLNSGARYHEHLPLIPSHA